MERNDTSHKQDLRFVPWGWRSQTAKTIQRSGKETLLRTFFLDFFFRFAKIDLAWVWELIPSGYDFGSASSEMRLPPPPKAGRRGEERFLPRRSHSPITGNSNRSPGSGRLWGIAKEGLTGMESRSRSVGHPSAKSLSP